MTDGCATEGKNEIDTAAEVAFSIVTVTYNCADTLEATIESVLAQRCKDYEYIIIDGGSTDGTVDIIKRYADRLAYWCSERDKGIYDGMNKGAAHSRGRWIQFLNSGDLLADEDVLTVVADHAAKDGCDVIYGDIYIDKRGVRQVKTAAEPCNKHRMYFCHQSAFVRTPVMQRMGFDLRFKMSADLHFFKRCRVAGLKFSHIHRPLVFFDRHGVSNTNRLSGLLDNVRVIKDLDRGSERFNFLFHLYFVIYRIKMSAFLKKKP